MNQTQDKPALPVICASDGGLAVYLAHQWQELEAGFRPTVLTYREDPVDELWSEVGARYHQLLDLGDPDSVDCLVDLVVGLDCPAVLLHLAQRSKVFAPVFNVLIGKLRLAGVGICAVVHEVLPYSDSPVPREWIAEQYGLLDTALVASEREKKRILEISTLEPSDVQVVSHPPYHLLRRSGKSDLQARQALDLADGQRLVLHFGMARKCKGVSLLIRAFHQVSRQYPEARLICHTNTQHHFSASWHAEAERISGERGDSVRLITHYLGVDEIETLFRACELVVLPYLEGIQSGVYNLARAYHKPVLVSEVMVREGDLPLPPGQVFQTGDVDHLAARLSDLLKLPRDELAGFGVAGAGPHGPRDSWEFNGRATAAALGRAAEIAGQRKSAGERVDATA